MDYSRGIQTLRETTEEVTSNWINLYHKIKESTFVILFVFCISKILYIIMSGLYNLISWLKK
jgi:hypothetical protein